MHSRRDSLILGGMLVAASLLTSAHAASDLDRAAFMRLAGSMVEVEAAGVDGRVWIGTGVVVAREHVVTSCHVTRRAESIRIQARGGSRPVSAQSADLEHDLCILLIPGLAVQPARLGGADQLGVGQPVWAMGFEGGRALRTRPGIVRALHAYDGARVVESTTPFTSGASGGALFDADGRLVAILTYRLPGDRRSYFSVPVEWLSARLAHEPSYTPIAPLDEAAPFWQRPQERLPYFLRAHQLEVSGDWSGLLALAAEWCAAEGGNAEAWLFRARGLAATSDANAARLALRHAVALDPVFVAGWIELARVAAQNGASEEAQHALAELGRLNPGLAQCVQAQMDDQRWISQTAALNSDACSNL